MAMEPDKPREYPVFSSMNQMNEQQQYRFDIDDSSQSLAQYIIKMTLQFTVRNWFGKIFPEQGIGMHV